MGMRSTRQYALLAVVSGVASLFASPAQADYTFYRTSPHTGACWNYVSAYGGVYQVSNNLLNGTSSSHTAKVQSYRPGVGLQASHEYTATAGQWKNGPIVNVAIFPNDEFRYYLNGALIVNIPANGIPYYMNHCKVAISPSTKIRSAISYGLSMLDSVYTGACAGSYRFGAAPTNGMWHYGWSCNSGQGNYYQPAGRRGFDCSGLVYKMFEHAGVPFSWTSSTSMKNGIPQVSKSSIKVGDLLVKYGHVAVYLGDGDGDGIASVLEATPKFSNSDGSTTGVIISDATKYLQDPAYTAHRVPGT